MRLSMRWPIPGPRITNGSGQFVAIRIVIVDDLAGLEIDGSINIDEQNSLSESRMFKHFQA